MNVKFKSLVAAAAFIAAGAASAAVVTVAPGATYKNHLFTGSELLTFGAQPLNAVNAFPLDVTNVSPATVTVTKSTTSRVRVTGVSMSSPVASLAIEDTTDELVTISGLGGFQFTATADGMLSDGGSAAVTNLTVDLANMAIRGDIRGTNANGTSVLSNIVLWRFTTVAGVRNALTTAAGTTNSLNISGLTLTPEAVAAIEQGLQTLEFGSVVIEAMTNFGTLQVDLVSTIAPLTTCTVDFAAKAVRAGQLSNTVTVRNLTTSPATGWAVQWQYANPVIVSSVKNATVTRNDAKTYTAKPLKTNTVLVASGSTAFTFNTLYSGTAPVSKVLSATVAGQACGISQR